ncbi:MAG: hypothetical protein OHK0023_18690 [Anaerolineae bacterium]
MTSGKTIPSNTFGHQFLNYFLVSQTVFLAYWVAMYPGVMAHDSFVQWIQIETGNYDNWHPYIHTLWINLLRLGANTPALATLAQLTLSSVIFSAFSAWLVTQNVSVRLVTICHFLLVLWPATGIYNVTLWKDVTAAQFVLLFAFGFLVLCRQRFDLNKYTIGFAVLLGAVGFMATILRHNHFVLLLVLPLCVWWLTIQRAIFKAIFTITLIGFFLLANIPIWTGLIPDTQRSQFPIFQLWILSYQLVNGSPTLTELDRAFLEDLLPEFGQDTACLFWDVLHPYAETWLLTDPVRLALVDQIFWREVVANPTFIVAQRTCTFMATLGLRSYRWVYQDRWINAPADVANTDYTRHLNTPPPIGPLYVLVRDFLDWTDDLPQRYLFWNHLFGLVAVAAIGQLGLIRKDRALIGVFIIYASLIAVLFVINVSADWRYLLFVYLFSFYALPIARLRES